MRKKVEFLEEHARTQAHLADLLLVLPAASPERIRLELEAIDLDQFRRWAPRGS